MDKDINELYQAAMKLRKNDGNNLHKSSKVQRLQILH